MHTHRRILSGVAATAMTVLGMAGMAAAGPAVAASALALSGGSTTLVPTVVAAGLNQPKKITITPFGNLLVAESGLNTPPAGCHDGSQPACVDSSGAIARISLATHQVTTAVGGLPSVATGMGPGSAGPVNAVRVGDRFQVLMQGTSIDPTTGAPLPATPNSHLMNKLVSTSIAGTGLVQEADLGAYEAANNPDNGAGSGEQNAAIDSDPYAVVPYLGGLAIADAAGNDVLFYRDGQLSTLAVLPLIAEHVPAGGLGPGSPPTTVMAQGVPTSLAVGPDGQLYIGELGGGPYDVGDTNIYKVYPGGPLQTVATGLTMVGDIAFDHSGRLLALEIDTAGLSDPATQHGLPAPGALIRLNHDGSRTTLARAGLEFPLGMAVAGDGTIYISNFGVVQGHNDPYVPPASGEVVSLPAGTGN